MRTQWERHRPYGGVVPEIAARAHVECLDVLTREAMREAGVGFDDLDAVAATAGPGLIGGLIVGLVTAKAIALARRLPFVAVHHLEAHALTVGLTEGLKPPYLLLLVSGGHTQLLIVRGVGDYERLGTTIDDALGEAFDKTAKLLGLGFPGGPAVEQAAREGRPRALRPAAPHAGTRGAAFLLRRPEDGGAAHSRAAGTVAGAGRRRHRRRLRGWRSPSPSRTAVRGPWTPRKRLGALRHFVVAGGVAANVRLRAALSDLATARGFTFHVPPVPLCSDNAAMIAWAGAERLALGLTDPLDAPVRPRWPLDLDAQPAIGAGVKA